MCRVIEQSIWFFLGKSDCYITFIVLHKSIEYDITVTVYSFSIFTLTDFWPIKNNPTYLIAVRFISETWFLDFRDINPNPAILERSYFRLAHFPVILIVLHYTIKRKYASDRELKLERNYWHESTYADKYKYTRWRSRLDK